MSKREASLALCFSLVVAAGCGGAVAQDAFDTSQGGDGGGASGDAASGDSGDSGGGGGGGGGGDAGRRDSGGGSTDAGGTVDSGGNTTPDPGITCGSGTYCSASTQYCCANLQGTTFTCTSRAVVACAGIKAFCDDKADCPVGVCCGTFVANTGYTAIECKATCAGGTGNTSYVRFCDPAAAQDECAATGRACTGSSASLPGYHYCQ